MQEQACVVKHVLILYINAFYVRTNLSLKKLVQLAAVSFTYLCAGTSALKQI